MQCNFAVINNVTKTRHQQLLLVPSRHALPLFSWVKEAQQNTLITNHGGSIKVFICTQLTPINISIILFKNKAYRSVRVTTVALKKQQILHILSVAVACIFRRAKRMRRAILTSVACPALPYFPTLSHKRHDFRGEGELFSINLCFDFLYNFCLKHFLVPRRIERDIVNVRTVGLQVKCPLFLSYFDETWIFWADFRKIFKYKI
jgi:hypothetical protein